MDRLHFDAKMADLLHFDRGKLFLNMFSTCLDMVHTHLKEKFGFLVKFPKKSHK